MLHASDVMLALAARDPEGLGDAPALGALGPDAELPDVLRVMARHRAATVAIVDGGGRAIGVVRHLDALRAMAEEIEAPDVLATETIEIPTCVDAPCGRMRAASRRIVRAAARATRLRDREGLTRWVRSEREPCANRGGARRAGGRDGDRAAPGAPRR